MRREQAQALSMLVEVNSGNPLPEVGTLGTLPYSPQGNVDWNKEKEGEAPRV